MPEQEMAPGEVVRALTRIENRLKSLEEALEERLERAFTEISLVRHKVMNLETSRGLEMHLDIPGRVAQLERDSVANEAVAKFKGTLIKSLIGGSLLATILIVLQIIALVRGMQ